MQRSEKNDSKHKLNATFAVRNRSGKMCNGPKRSSLNTSYTRPLRSGIGPDRFTTVRQATINIYELNFAVRNRSGKIFNGPTRSSQNTTQHSRSGIGPNRSGIALESSATVRQEAVKIQAKRNTRGPESVRIVLQRSEKKQSKYKLNATLAVRNRSGIGPERFATVRKEAFKIQAKPSLCGPESVRKALTWSESSQPLLVKEGEGKDSRFKRFRAVSDLFRTCFGLQSSGQY